MTPAIDLRNVSKIYRRYSGRQFATLKSALLLTLATIGLSLTLAACNVYFRDLTYLWGIISQLWFFATPIIYYWRQENVLRFKPLFDLNPFTHLAISYQEILFFPGPFGHWKWLVALGAGSIALFLAAYWLFDRLRDSFAEAV